MTGFEVVFGIIAGTASLITIVLSIKLLISNNKK